MNPARDGEARRSGRPPPNFSSKSPPGSANSSGVASFGRLDSSYVPEVPSSASLNADLENHVKETRHIKIDYNPVNGRKTLNTYEIVRELGRGEHGRVKLGLDVENNTYVAIKVISRKGKPRLGWPQSSTQLEKVYREIAILKKCQHPNIVRLLEVLDDAKCRKIYLVLEFCQKGEIRWQLPDGKPALTREQARSLARDLALGLEYLHMNHVIHRDIKPANLLVADDNVVKISDFGVSYLISNAPTPQSELELAKTVGTPAFFSPELCLPTEIQQNGERKQPNISAKLDIWAFGVTMFCLLHGYLPFDADNEYELFRVIANDEPNFPHFCSDEDLALANDMLRKMLIKDPTKRPTATEVKSHPWMLKNLSKNDKEMYLHGINNNGERIEVSREDVDHAVQDASVKGQNIKSRFKKQFSWLTGHVRSRKRDDKKPKPPGSKSSSTSTVATVKMANLSLGNGVRDATATSSNQSHNSDDSISSGSGLSGAVSCTSLVDQHPDGAVLSGRSITFDAQQPPRKEAAGIARDSATVPIMARLPEIDLAAIDSDSFWDYPSRGSSGNSSDDDDDDDDDDGGELTLIVGRNRSRSETSGRPQSMIANSNGWSLDPSEVSLPE